jgi:glycosyltransferase involved in cell wall biosynthesis
LNDAVVRLGRVVFFNAYPHVYGGVERSLQLLATGLQRRGWSVDLVFPSDGPAVELFRSEGLSVDVVQAPSSLLRYGRAATRGTKALAATAALPTYWAHLRRRLSTADVVHTFAQRGFVLAGPAARMARKPAVWHVGGTDPGRLLNHAAARMATAVIAVSPSAASGLPGSLAVVPNAVDPRAFEAAAASDAFHVACAARLTPEKGVDVLLHAAAVLRADVPDLRVLLLGGAQSGHETYQADLVRLSRELGLSEAVCFRGFVDQPFRQWSGARVYVQPSRREGFGLAAAEAMASGLPVVATSVGGLTDLLDFGRAGVLVPPDDPPALAGAIKALLDDQEGCDRVANAGRARAAAEYTVDAMVDGVEAVYRKVLRSPSRG